VRSHAKAPVAGTVWIASAAALLLALVLMAVLSSSALAAVGQSVIRTFSTGPGQPYAVAADDGGNVYVFKPGAGRLEKFDSAGNPIPFAASSPYIAGNKLLGTPDGPLSGPLAFFEPRGSVAVDNSGGPNDGHIYLANGGNAYVFDASGAYLGQLGQKQEFRCAVAMNPSDGSVYMPFWFRETEPGNGIKSGAVERYGAPDEISEAAEPIEDLVNETTNKQPNCNLQVDAADAVFFTDLNGNAVKYPASQFDAASPSPSVVFDAAGALNSFSPLALNSSNGDLYAASGGQILKWNSSGTPLSSPAKALGEPSGLAVGSAGNLVATEPGGGVFVFGPNPVQLPAGTTGASSNVTPTSADVEGSADPDGAGNITACEFRYGEDTGYADGSVPCTPGAPIVSPSAVSAQIGGLVSGTTYHYRLFLTNANGTQISTGDQSFTTPIATEGVFTGGPSEVGRDSAVLNGGYVGDGQDVHYFFEWGRTNDYDHTTPVPPGGDAGTESGPLNVAPIQISGLEVDRTYHYRLVISTPSGITRGQDEAFTTLPAVTALTTEAATQITGTSAQLHASFEGDGTSETHYFFEWGSSAAYGNKTPAPPGVAVPATSGKVDLDPVTISGLDGASTYHFRVVASNATGTTAGNDLRFKTAEAPVLSNLGTRNVTAGSAELTGEINPRYGRTAYHFEWGPTAAYGNVIPVPSGDAGNGNSLVAVSAQLGGLSPESTYHFRLVASNEYGTTTSTDQTFGFYPPACPNSQLRQETRSNDLPDCRAYELVTPSFAQGTTILPAAGPTSGLATNPARLAYGALYGLFPETSGEAMNGITDAYVSTRSEAGWSQRYVGFEGGRGVGGHGVLTGGPPGAILFSPFTGVGPGDSLRGAQATPTLDRMTIYNWGFPGQIESHAPASNAPYVWDTSNGNPLGRWPSNLAQVPDGEGFVGFPQASADFSHFVFSSNVPFAEGGEEREEEIACCGGPASLERAWPKASIYDNDLRSGAVVLASRKADETPFEGRAFDVSEDGSHILMAENSTLKGKTTAPLVPSEATLGAEVRGPLYLRVNARETYEIAPGRKLEYLASTADGATVYLASNERLTADDHDQSRDLFVWRQSDPNSLTRVSFGDHGNAGNTDACSPNEQWTIACGVMAVRFSAPRSINGEGGNGHTDAYLASKSGDVYFESPEQLVGAKGEAGERNLYLYRGGTVRYVTTMSPSRRVARMQVTPDGRYAALITASNLTAYDSGGHLEMYVYDAAAGRIACASCRPDGLQPLSDVLGSQNGLFLTNDGRAFFTTKDALQPRDTNQTDDVYEFTEAKPQLITSGTGPSLDISAEVAKPGLVGVSANGTDVYFATIDHLVTQDHNGSQLKIYDARTGGGFPAEREVPKCVAADECHGASSNPPASPPDRTGAALGAPRKAKAHKAKKHKKAHKHRKHKKKRAGKAKQKPGSAKQGGKRHG